MSKAILQSTRVKITYLTSNCSLLLCTYELLGMGQKLSLGDFSFRLNLVGNIFSDHRKFFYKLTSRLS